MRARSICAGFVLLGCTPHEQELAGPALSPESAPAEMSRPAPAVEEPPADDEAADPPAPVPFPEVYCAYRDEQDGRWRIVIDPTDRDSQRRAERLLEGHPNANGVDGALARSNLPERWRELDAVTLVRTGGVNTTGVRAAGVVPAASGGAFTFVLRARVSSASDGRALAIDGHPSPLPDALRPVPVATVDEARWANVGRSVREHVRGALNRVGRPGIAARHVRWVAADLGGGVEGLMIHAARRRPGEFPSFSVVAASDGSADAVAIPIYEGGTPIGAQGVTDEAYYEPLALSDLDRDGHDEVLVRENWYEGYYDWLVRHDDEDGVVATLLCGDAY